MNRKTLQLLNNLNRAVIQWRGIYSEWSKKHNISYNEMLVLYTLREFGYCTQKMVCDSYLLPRQTINNVFIRMRAEGLVVFSPQHCHNREKAFVLTDKGEEYAKNFMADMNIVEEKAVSIMGEEKMQMMTDLILQYNTSLKNSLKEHMVEKNKNGTEQ